MDKQLNRLFEKYGEDLPDYISAKIILANLEQEYWQKVNDAYFD